MADPIVWNGTQPLFVSHRGQQNVWSVERHDKTIYGNHVVFFGSAEGPPPSVLVLVVDEAGWPIEANYGYDYKEYRVVNDPNVLPP